MTPQVVFYNQSAEGASSGEQLGQITLPQFRGVMTATRVSYLVCLSCVCCVHMHGQQRIRGPVITWMVRKLTEVCKCTLMKPHITHIIHTQATTSRFTAENVDNVFTSVATSATTIARKMDNKSGVSTFGLLDFILAVVHVAYHRYAIEQSSQVGRLLQ